MLKRKKNLSQTLIMSPDISPNTFAQRREEIWKRHARYDEEIMADLIALANDERKAKGAAQKKEMIEGGGKKKEKEAVVGRARINGDTTRTRDEPKRKRVQSEGESDYDDREEVAFKPACVPCYSNDWNCRGPRSQKGISCCSRCRDNGRNCQPLDKATEVQQLKAEIMRLTVMESMTRSRISRFTKTVKWSAAQNATYEKQIKEEMAGLHQELHLAGALLGELIEGNMESDAAEAQAGRSN